MNSDTSDKSERRYLFPLDNAFSSHFLHIPCTHRISEFNVAFDPLHFVLMFPRGEAGWGLGIQKGVLRNVPNAMPVVDQASWYMYAP